MPSPMAFNICSYQLIYSDKHIYILICNKPVLKFKWQSDLGPFENMSRAPNAKSEVVVGIKKVPQLKKITASETEILTT